MSPPILKVSLFSFIIRDYQFLLKVMFDYITLLTKTGTLNSKRTPSAPILEGFPDVVTSAYVTINKVEPRRCVCCNSIIPVDSFRVGWRHNQIACSIKCASSTIAEKRKQTMLDKYGVENASQSEELKQKRKTTNLERFGVEYSLSAAVVRSKIIATLEDRYGNGITSPTQIPGVREKQQATMIEKYGCVNPLQNGSILNKSLSTKRIKYNWKEKAEPKKVYGFPYKKLLAEDVMLLLNDKEALIKKYETHGALELSEMCGCNQQLVMSYLRKHGYTFPRSRRNWGSSVEKKITNFLDDLGIAYETHNRTILDGKEIDIFIPSHNLGIEVHGNYYHSYNPLSAVVGIADKNYHKDKFNLAKEKGITLIQFFEDQIYSKMDIIKSMIRNKLGRLENRIFARHTTIQSVSTEIAREFCEKNHLNGYSSSSTRLGLFDTNGELVSLMTFRKNRFSTNADFEVIRFCTKLNTTVVGGGSKLIKSFMNSVSNGSKLTTYADCMVGNGSSYEKMGFEFLGHSVPGYYWVDVQGNRKNRMVFQRGKLETIFGKEFDPTLTEDQIMFSEGFRKLFNAGNYRFSLTK